MVAGALPLSPSLKILVTFCYVVNVESSIFLHRRADPKVGFREKLIVDSTTYEKQCGDHGLLPMFNAGARGVIRGLDLSTGEAEMQSDGGDVAWVPITSIQGFESWSKDHLDASDSASTERAVLTPAVCTGKCSTMGHMNNDPAAGSDQVLSCSQACMIRARGSSETECKTNCNRNGASGCSVNVNGHKYDMCAARSDYSVPALKRLMANKACDDGCSMQGKVPQAPAALAKNVALTPATCTDRCSKLGHMNNDPSSGSDQVLSCSQACMIRARGSSKTECKTNCNRNGASGCTVNVNGHLYSMCAARSEYSAEALNRLVANRACDDGCSMQEKAPAPGNSIALTPVVCTDRCTTLGHMNNDPSSGSDQVLSCSQACMVRARGSSKTECKSNCNRHGASGCSVNINGHSYSMCAARSDYSVEALNRLMANEACQDGCSMEASANSLQSSDTGDGSKVATDLWYAGCQRIDDMNSVTISVDAQLYDMTIAICFAKCKKQKGMKYLALSSGAQCLCSISPPGQAIDASSCNKACSGKTSEICGGDSTHIASVYTMVNCSPLPHIALDDKYKEALYDLYESWEGQSCRRSEDNLCEINGTPRMAANLEDCKLACWEARGSEKCNGFTYDKVMGECTFYQDVLDGTASKGRELACFFKKSGYPM